MTRRPPPTRRQGEAFIVAAHAARRTLHEIMRAAAEQWGGHAQREAAA